ncbi:hypothetical protein ANN_03581 [Periplaneta americana]|uniref:Uncharacterized protein n=1 Tax=Periplaneta americana TaxID=6978 RepID=A0ABQ8TZF2_PERAM|nr:hypothetical protein ANN_03581 [Periplaneta americana]
MAGLCEGGNEPPGSLKAKLITSLYQRIPNLTGPVDNNDVTLQRNRTKLLEGSMAIMAAVQVVIVLR